MDDGAPKRCGVRGKLTPSPSPPACFQSCPVSPEMTGGRGVLLSLAETAAMSWRLWSQVVRAAATGNARSPMAERLTKRNACSRRPVSKR